MGESTDPSSKNWDLTLSLAKIQTCATPPCFMARLIQIDAEKQLFPIQECTDCTWGLYYLLGNLARTKNKRLWSHVELALAVSQAYAMAWNWCTKINRPTKSSMFITCGYWSIQFWGSEDIHVYIHKLYIYIYIYIHRYHSLCIHHSLSLRGSFFVPAWPSIKAPRSPPPPAIALVAMTPPKK